MNELLESISLKDIMCFILGGIAVLSVVVEKISNFPFKPWSQLFEWLGKCLTKSMNTELEQIKQQQQTNNEEIQLNNPIDDTYIPEIYWKDTRKMGSSDPHGDILALKQITAYIQSYNKATMTATIEFYVPADAGQLPYNYVLNCKIGLIKE